MSGKKRLKRKNKPKKIKRKIMKIINNYYNRNYKKKLAILLTILMINNNILNLYKKVRLLYLTNQIHNISNFCKEKS